MLKESIVNFLRKSERDCARYVSNQNICDNRERKKTCDGNNPHPEELRAQ